MKRSRPYNSVAVCNALGIALALLAAAVTGCSRARYRLNADRDVHYLIDGARQDPRRPLPNYTIQPDPRSRMFDPNDPDRPPMPPDDPAGHKYMHCVDCKKGWPCWHANGDTPFVENPDWKMFVPLDEQGRLELDLRGAIATAWLNSPDYQRQLEELYLSALDVSFERFRFDTQFFGGYGTQYETTGVDLPGGPANELTIATRNPTGDALEARKMFATGGELIVGAANSIMWEFTGANNQAGLTLLDFSFVQPLLRSGGRLRVLERLTIAERALLYNVRQMERFRRGFYAEIAAGIAAGSGPSRRGGFAGGAGLEGFTGVGAGGFGRLGNVPSGGTTGTGAAQAGGFLGLLQDAQEIRNLDANVAALYSSLAELQAMFEANRIGRFQVELARQALYNGQSRLLTTRAAYQASVDSFKIDLGLPPDTPVVLADNMLDRFNLIEPQLSAAQTFAGELLGRIRDPDLDLTDETWSDILQQSGELFRRVEQQIDVARRDVKRFRDNLPGRRRSLRRLADRPEIDDGQVDQEAFSVERLDKLAQNADDFLDELVVRYAAATAQFESIFTPVERARLTDILARLNEQLGDLLLLQARAKLEAVVLPRVELAPQYALTIARDNRLDWMNARGQLVDAWRLIEFNANDLKSDLDLVFDGDIRSDGNNPFNLQGNAGRLRVGLEFDAPLSRLGERNNYRQSLIEYQQARRNYYTFVDRVNQGLRSTLRNVRLNQLNFEMRRAAVQLAISQVELARLELQEPPRVGVELAGSDNRVQNLVNALTQLLDAQNDFLSIWVNYEVLRLSLDFGLGTMRLDDQGQWIDPGTIVPDTLPLPLKMPYGAEEEDQDR